MNQWIKSTLGKVSSKIITGPFGSQLHQSDYIDTGIAVIMPQNIGDRCVNYDSIFYISESDANRLSRYRVKSHDIVYSRRGDVEKHALVREENTKSFCGTGCFLVRLDTNKVYPEFVSFYLNRPESKTWLRQHAVGSNMLNLNRDILSNVPFSYPHEIKTQKALVYILSLLDRKIRLNNTINAELEKIAKTLYNYWFVQFDFPNAKGKPYRASGSKMEYNEVLKREIPKGWQIKQLKEICRIKSGYPFSSKSYLKNGKFRLIAIKNVQEDGVNLNVDSFLETIPENMPDYCLLHPGDILMSLTGNVGRIGLMFENDCLLNQRVAVIQPVSETVEGYCYFLLRSDYIRTIMENMASGSSQDNLSPIDTENILLPFDSKIISDYNTKITPIVQYIVSLKMQNKELTEFRDFLLPLLMNGQVVVKNGKKTYNGACKTRS